MLLSTSLPTMFDGHRPCVLQILISGKPLTWLVYDADENDDTTGRVLHYLYEDIRPQQAKN